MYSQSSHSGHQSGAGRASRRELSAVSKASSRTSGSNTTGLSPGRTRRRTTSNHRSHSPHHYGTAMDGHLTSESAHHHQSTGRSPYQSPAHSRSSSMTSVKSLLRDRSLERDWDIHGMHGERQSRAPLVRDRSLDRQLDNRQQRVSDHRPSSARERSLDRSMERGDYAGHLSARSLERGEYGTHVGSRGMERDSYGVTSRRLTRSRSIDHEFLLNQGSYMPAANDLRNARDTLLLDMQSSVNDLNRECLSLTQELELMREKLSTSMNSIKTFWSPELKKERCMRKEESAKYSMLLQQLHQSQQQLKKHEETLKLLQGDALNQSVGGAHSFTTSAQVHGSMVGTDALRKEKERQAKEIAILRKTIEEMDLRIDTQKQTLNARDESIKKLLEMLQSKGIAKKQLDEDRLTIERLQVRVTEDSRRIQQLESILEQRDSEVARLREALQSGGQYYAGQTDNAHIESLRAQLLTKDSHIHEIERQKTTIEEELRIMKENMALGDTTGLSLDRQLNSEEKLLRTKVDHLKLELSKKDAELYTLHTQMETLQKQASDHQQHIRVLREQVEAKDQQSALIGSELEHLREKLKDKEAMIDKKSKQALAAQLDKKKIEGEHQELSNHMNIKDRKISVLQRKIDSFDEMLKDKDEQLTLVKQRLATLTADHSTSDSRVADLEDTLAEKERHLTRLKEQRERSEKEHLEESDMLRKAQYEMTSKIQALQRELEHSQRANADMQDSETQLKSDTRGLEKQLAQTEMALKQSQSNVASMESRLKQLEQSKLQLEQSKLQLEQSNHGDKQRIAKEAKSHFDKMEKELTAAQEKAKQSQKEADRLLELMGQMEGDKCEKDHQIHQLQMKIKDLTTKLGGMKHSQQADKTKNARMLEEARKREDTVADDISQLKTVIERRDQRINELEETLRESVKITAEREMLITDQESLLKTAQQQTQTAHSQLEKIKAEKTVLKARMSELESYNTDQQQIIQQYRDNRCIQLQQVYEMKQEALLSSLSEKDSHVALLEAQLHNSKHTTAIKQQIDQLQADKKRLNAQLKQLTQNRIHLLQDINDNPSSDDAPLSVVATTTLQHHDISTTTVNITPTPNSTIRDGARDADGVAREISSISSEGNADITRNTPTPQAPSPADQATLTLTSIEL